MNQLPNPKNPRAYKVRVNGSSSKRVAVAIRPGLFNAMAKTANETVARAERISSLNV